MILQRLFGPPMPTAMGCFFPQNPLDDHSTSFDTMSTVFSILKATPVTVVSSSARPSFPFLIS